MVHACIYYQIAAVLTASKAVARVPKFSYGDVGMSCYNAFKFSRVDSWLFLNRVMIEFSWQTIQYI